MLHLVPLGLVLESFDEATLDRTRNFGSILEPRMMVALIKGHSWPRHGVDQVWPGERGSYEAQT